MLGALGMSAATAATVSTVVAGVAIASTVGATAMNVADTWLEIDNPVFNAIQTTLNVTSTVTNAIYDVGAMYNSIKKIDATDWVASNTKAVEKTTDAIGATNAIIGKNADDIANSTDDIVNAVDDVTNNAYNNNASKTWNKSTEFRGQKVHQRDDLFDPDQMTTWKHKGEIVSGTNTERMLTGRAPIGRDGKAVELHHMLQTNDGPLAEISATFHDKYKSVIHINKNTTPSGINRNQFNTYKRNYWKNRALDFAA